VGVGHHLLTQSGFAWFFSPILREGDKKLLIAREPILYWRRLARKRCPVSIQGRRDAGHVGNILGQSLLESETQRIP